MSTDCSSYPQADLLRRASPCSGKERPSAREGVPLGLGPDPDVIDAGYDDGWPIADAIRKFEKETGVAPDDLMALTPKYLTAVPEDSTRFQYSKRAMSLTDRWLLTFWEEDKMFSFVSGHPGLWLTGDYDGDYPPEKWTRMR